MCIKYLFAALCLNISKQLHFLSFRSLLLAGSCHDFFSAGNQKHFLVRFCWMIYVTRLNTAFLMWMLYIENPISGGVGACLLRRLYLSFPQPRYKVWRSEGRCSFLAHIASPGDSQTPDLKGDDRWTHTHTHAFLCQFRSCIFSVPIHDVRPMSSC